jgi:hypothetical protein
MGTAAGKGGGITRSDEDRTLPDHPVPAQVPKSVLLELYALIRHVEQYVGPMHRIRAAVLIEIASARQ